MFKKILFITFCFALLSRAAFASEETNLILQSFQKVLLLSKIEIVVPTIVEVPIPSAIYNSNFAVYNKTQDTLEPYMTLSKTSDIEKTPQNITTLPVKADSLYLFDENFETFTQFDVDENGVGYVEIKYNFSEHIRSTSLYLSLEPYVSLPSKITIKTIENGEEKIILSQVRPSTNVLNFVETSARDWKIEIQYSQPLRINELQIKDLNYKQSPRVVRFLAQPNVEYQIFAEPDLIKNQKTGEQPNLYSNEGIRMIKVLETVANTTYVLSDIDSDGVPDIRDNCVNIPNPNQEDIDSNGRGDACDDFDRDGIINSSDNCVNIPNVNQEDTDLDGIGDACDTQESRFTEKYPWLVWAGIIFAGLLFLSLFAIAIVQVRKNRGQVDDKNPIV